jgi:spermidine synthase
LDEVCSSARHFEALFLDWHFFTAAIPTYAGGIMAFGWASDNPELRRHHLKTVRQRFFRSGITTRYYTPDIHRSAFALPQYILEAIGKPSR